jgi:serpin B
MKKSLLVIAVLPLFFSCEKSGEVQIKAPVQITLSAAESEIAGKNNAFTFNFLSRVIKANEGNIMVSPYSLAACLSMTANGAAGDTRDSILTAIGFKDESIQNVNNYFYKITGAISGADPTTKLAIANSIWYRNTLTAKPSFINSNQTYYNALIKALDFNSASSPSIIDNWISDNTNGLIKDVIKYINPSELMFIINAVYFKATWAKDYDFTKQNTTVRDFVTSKKEYCSVNMMNKMRSYKSVISNEYSAVAIPYGNNSFEYIAILPATGISTEDLAVKLSDEGYFSNMINSFSYKNVLLGLPKFKYRFNTSLNTMLTGMGMGIALDSQKADYSEIFENTGAYLSDIFQYNYIELNEEGTEAASVTVAKFAATSGPAYEIIEFNRPFIYIIREKSSGVILFAGKVENPAKN